MKHFFLCFTFCISGQILVAQGVPIRNFGANPGNLKMYMYSPERLNMAASLVVVIHGCGQTASIFADNTEWNVLADIYGFHVLYPETYSTACFTWWNSTERDDEATSITQ